MDTYTTIEDPPEPPAGLSDRGARFWADVVGRYELRVPDELTILHELCRTLGVVDVLAGVLAQAQTLEQRGSMGQPTVHWAIPELRVQRALIVTLTKQLGLPAEEASDEQEAADAGARSRAARHAARARWDKRA